MFKSDNFSWMRPEGPLKTWRVAVCHNNKNKSKKPLNIVIRELPPGRHEEIITCMESWYLKEEPTAASLNVTEDKETLKQLLDMWRLVLKQGISIGAFIETLENDSSELAGYNILFVKTLKDKDQLFAKWQGPEYTSTFRQLIEFWATDDFERFNVDKYLSGYGLGVKPMYRGFGIGQHLLEVREDICREYNIRATSTIYTGIGSQLSATRAGYEILEERNYDKVVDDNGKMKYPIKGVKSCKFMGKKFF